MEGQERQLEYRKKPCQAKVDDKTVAIQQAVPSDVKKLITIRNAKWTLTGRKTLQDVGMLLHQGMGYTGPLL